MPKNLGIIDSIIKEPEGGAHRSLDFTAAAIKQTLLRDLTDMDQLDAEGLREHRIKKIS